MIPDFIDGLLLSTLQPLPLASRRLLAKKLSAKGLFSAAVDIRDEEEFYEELLRTYDRPGTLNIVAAALKQIGGNSARRDLASSIREWACETLSLDEPGKKGLLSLVRTALTDGRKDVAAVLVWLMSLSPEPDDELLGLIEDHAKLAAALGAWRPWQDSIDEADDNIGPEVFAADVPQKMGPRPSPAQAAPTLSDRLSAIRDLTYRIETSWQSKDVEDIERAIAEFRFAYDDEQMRIAVAREAEAKYNKQAFEEAKAAFHEAVLLLEEGDWRSIDRDAALELIDGLTAGSQAADHLSEAASKLEIIVSARREVSSAAMRLGSASISETPAILEEYTAAQQKLSAATGEVKLIIGQLQTDFANPGPSAEETSPPLDYDEDQVSPEDGKNAEAETPPEQAEEFEEQVSGTTADAAPSDSPADQEVTRQPADVLLSDEELEPTEEADLKTEEPAEECVDDSALRAVQECLVSSLHAGRPGLALYFARAISELWNADLNPIPAEVIEAAIVGSSVSAPFDRPSDKYLLAQSELLSCTENLGGSKDTRVAAALLLWVGALRPSMLPPFSGRAVLDAIPLGTYKDLYRLGQTADEIGKSAGLASIGELSRAGSQSDPRVIISRAEDDLRQWTDHSRTRSSNYAPATMLWQQRLMGPAGRLTKVISEVLQRKPSAQRSVQELVRLIRDDADGFIDSEFAQMHARKAMKKLETPARHQLVALVKELRDLLEAWERANSAQGTASLDRLSPFRANLLRDLDAAKSCVADLASRESQPATVAAANFALESLRALEAEVMEGIERRRSFMSSLEDDLLLIPDFPLNGRRIIELRPDDVMGLVNAAVDGTINPTWQQAYDAAIARGSIDSARRIALVLDTAGTGDPEIRAAELENTLAETRHSAERSLVDVRDQLEDLQAAMLGRTLDNSLDEEFSELLGFNLDALPRENDGNSPDAVCDFPQLFQRLDQFRYRLEKERQEASDALRDRIEVLAANGHNVDELNDLVAAGDLGTLAEELAQVEALGADHSARQAVDRLKVFRSFMNELLPAWLADDAPWRSKAALLDAAKNGTRTGPLDFGSLPEADRQRAFALLEAWYGLRAGVDQKRARLGVPALLAELGFTGVKVEKEEIFRGASLLHVTTDVIASPDVCLVPAFGSKAAGRYAVVLVHKTDRAVLTGIVQNQNDLPDRPVIVIVSDTVPLALRNDFLKAARKNSTRAVALLDEATIGALAVQVARSLRDAFDLSIPFGVACPYNDRATETSPEMFFGRQSELDDLMNFEGSCLVYGGRQLGKTALLKQAYLRLRGRAERAVAYVDIRPVGDTEPSSIVWDRIGEALQGEGHSFAATQNARSDPGTNIGAWLNGDPERRLLILLDEADAFLESEIAENFPNIDVMKRLMDTHGRRAKFVFAGLHNVQRFARTPNSPLLHLGAPVKVGPLMGRDATEARRMVLEPMAAIGVDYERSADAARMLSLVGYYPSLVQTFGKSLVQQLDRDISRKAAPELPIKISRTDLDTCFQNADFRADLVQKFRATLELDRRYELIAYVICEMTDHDRRSGRVADGGYTDAIIRQQALEYWAAGFSDDDSPDAFHALLDEMVGLGVLEANGPYRYALRSARIAAMLGGPDQILEKLVEFEKAGPQRRRDPLANHRPLPNGGRSPLPLRREQALIDAPSGVLLIGGSVAMGIEDTTVALESLAGLRGWPSPRRLALSRDPVAEVTKVLNDNRYGGRPGAPKLIIAEEWPDIAVIEEIAGNRILRVGSSMRLALIGTPADVLKMELSGSAARLQAIRGVSRFDVEAWGEGAIRHWLAREAEIATDDHAVVAEIRRRSGGFSNVLGGVKLPRSERKSAEAILQRVQEAATAFAESISALDDVGLVTADARRFAEVLLEWDDDSGFDRDTAVMVAEDTGVDQARVLFDVFKRLSIVEEALSDREAADALFHVNPLVSQVLAKRKGV